MDRGLAAVVSLQQTLQKKNIPLCVLLAPRTIDVTVSDFAYPSDISDGLDATIQSAMQAGGVNSVELLETFREMHENGEYVYYRTDHHWTTKGAYTAYVAVMESWGMGDQVLPESYFTVREVPDFYGTTHSRAADGAELILFHFTGRGSWSLYAPSGFPEGVAAVFTEVILGRI